jgi:hypothetical protein
MSEVASARLEAVLRSGCLGSCAERCDVAGGVEPASLRFVSSPLDSHNVLFLGQIRAAPESLYMVSSGNTFPLLGARSFPISRHLLVEPSFKRFNDSCLNKVTT